MSEDFSSTIPDEPAQDPEAPQTEPDDDHGFSSTPDSGYDLGNEAPAIPSDEGAVVGSGDPASPEPGDPASAEPGDARRPVSD